MRSVSELRAYQIQAITLQINSAASALILDPGLGKTVVTLAAMTDLFDRLILRGVAILAPKRVCETVWEQECDEWDFLPRFRFAHVYGSKARREAALSQPADVYLVNYENWMWFVTRMAEDWVNQGKPLPFNGIVFDELSRMANKTAERCRYLRALIETGEIIWRTGLTATPCSNGLMKLQGEYQALDDGARLGSTKRGFQTTYFFYNPYSEAWEPQHRARERIFEKVRDITLAATKEDHLDLPPVTYNTISVELPPARMAEYREFEEEFYVELTEAEEKLEVFSVAQMMGKCLQYSNGAIYRPQSKEFYRVHEHKLDALETLIEALDGQPLLLCYCYRPIDSERIRERFPQAQDVHDFKDSQLMLDQWNAGEIPVLMGHPGSMGHGLNFQQHHNLCWFGLTWDLELYIQGNGRLDRQGQEHPVVVNRILCTDTLDFVVLRALKQKNVTQTKFIQLIKEHRR